MTFSYAISNLLQKKLSKLVKKDKILTIIFRKKVREIIENSSTKINRYKNFRKPLSDFKRIRLTDKFILLFKVYPKDNHILFVDVKHRDISYK